MKRGEIERDDRQAAGEPDRMLTDGSGTRPADVVAGLQLVNEQLRGALDSRIVIEQAKGILSERFGLPIDEAFALLRYSARRNRTSLRALARAVVSSPRSTPEPILAAMAPWQRMRPSSTTSSTG